jgi:hypothetical protein
MSYTVKAKRLLMGNDLSHFKEAKERVDGAEKRRFDPEKPSSTRKLNVAAPGGESSPPV